MKRLLMATMALAMAGGAAYAGPNAGGTLILHANTTIVYTTDVEDYCGSGTGGSQGGLVLCADAVNHVEGAGTVVFFAIGAFPDGSSPRVSGLVFGVNYPSQIALVAQGSCADFELATGGWPASGEGTAITWNTTQQAQLVEAYWFAGYNYYSPDPHVFALGLHPTQGGDFGDDAVPANLDPIQGFGSLGFDAPGFTPCPTGGPTPGACCLPNFGGCVILSGDECAAAGGAYLGDGSDCDPDPCPIAPREGACCIGTECVILTADQCGAQGGSYQGDDSDCDPDPCGIIPTENTTWGAIKALHR